MNVVGGKAVALLRQVAFVDLATLPSYDDDGVRQVVEELNQHLEMLESIIDRVREEDGLSEQDRPDLQAPEHQDKASSIIMHLDSVLRIKRCLLAYHNERVGRIKELRWRHGRGIPGEFLPKLSKAEQEFHKAYDAVFTSYCQTLDLDLTTDMSPPKDNIITIKVLQTVGEVFFSFPGFVKLEKGSVHVVSQEEAEGLIREGKLEVVDAFLRQEF